MHKYHQEVHWLISLKFKAKSNYYLVGLNNLEVEGSNDPLVLNTY